MDESGLVIREEWRYTDGSERTVERKTIPRDATIAESMTRQSVLDQAAAERKERRDKLQALSYPVAGLNAGLDGLQLTWIVPGENWKSVRLEYRVQGQPEEQSGISIMTYDLKSNPDYPAELLVPLSDAKIEGGVAGVRLSFKWNDDVAVQLISTEPTLTMLNGNLKEYASRLIAAN